MRIPFLITQSVVLAVCRDPIECRTFSRKSAQECQRVTDKAVSLETGMSEQAMEAQANPDAASKPMKENREHEPLPRKEERSSQGTHVQSPNPKHYGPVIGSTCCELTVMVRRGT